MTVIMEGVVQGAVETACVKTVPAVARARTRGPVGYGLETPSVLSARSESTEMRRTFGREAERDPQETPAASRTATAASAAHRSTCIEAAGIALRIQGRFIGWSL